MNIPEGYVEVDMHKLWDMYIEYMKGKSTNPFLQCGCITPSGIHYPIETTPTTKRN